MEVLAMGAPLAQDGCSPFSVFDIRIVRNDYGDVANISLVVTVDNQIAWYHVP